MAWPPWRCALPLLKRGKKMTTRTIIVTARKRDSRNFTVQKYDNDATWNVVGGVAPNGVSASRYLRKTTPDIANLSPLASWLVLNVPEYCGGKMPHTQAQSRVRVYNGRTEAEQIMYEAISKKCCQGQYYPTVDEAVKFAELACKSGESYLNKPVRVDDWLFDIIEPNQSDEDYWNRQADKMLASSAVKVTIGSSEWNL
jgi:hypothetical protein